MEVHNKVQDFFHMTRFADNITHVIAFDKVFSGVHCVHLALLIMNSKNVRYFIMCKGHFSKGNNKCMIGSSSAGFYYDNFLAFMGFKLVLKVPSLLMNGGESSGSFCFYSIPAHRKRNVTEHDIGHIFHSFFAPLGFSDDEENILKAAWTTAAKEERARANEPDIAPSAYFPEGPPDTDPKLSFFKGVYHYYEANAHFKKHHALRISQKLTSSCIVSDEYICIG